MGDSAFTLHDHHDQIRLVDESVHDTRPSVPTGFDELDSRLRRGGLLPGTFTLLGGRTGTRKSTIMENMVVNMFEAGNPVAIVGLDEPPWLYMVKLLSVWTGRSQQWVEDNWDEPEGQELQRSWKSRAAGLVHLTTGRRLGVDHLHSLLDMAALGTSQSPAVIFIDYVALLTREGDFGYAEQSRIPRLAEELQIWSTETGVSVVALHQLSRNDEHGGTNSRNAGHIPVTLSQLKYGGEEMADMVFGTYRPAMNPMAQMSFPVAQEVLGERFDEDAYWEMKAMAKKYSHSTFLQLLKNRPGTQTDDQGIELLSPTDSLKMQAKEREDERVAEVREKAAEGVRGGAD